jgi:hypothetical protein
VTYDRDDLLKLLHLLDVTATDEIDCDEFLHRAAGFVERYDPDDGEARIGPEHAALVQHLKVCPECLEELRALYAALRAED